VVYALEKMGVGNRLPQYFKFGVRSKAMQKSAIVTGTSSGLGAEIARLLIESGYQVVGVSRSPSKLLGGQAGYSEVLGDVAAADTAERALSVGAALGTFEMLINCAGAGLFGVPGENTPNDIAASIQTNLTGTILFSEACFETLKKNSGTLVNVGSTASLKAKANEAIYCAAKWGVRGYTDSLKMEAKGSGLKVLGAYPGGMKTAFWDTTEHTKGKRGGFMEAADVAAAIVAALPTGGSCGVSDIVLEAI
jgi:short-subunit dehydrogenase